MKEEEEEENHETRARRLSAEFVEGRDLKAKPANVAMFIVDAALTEDFTGSGLTKYWHEAIVIATEKNPYDMGYEVEYHMSLEQAEDLYSLSYDMIADMMKNHRSILADRIMRHHYKKIEKLVP